MQRAPLGPRHSRSLCRSPTHRFSAAEPVVEASDKGIDYYSIDSADQAVGFGDFSLIASQGETGRQFVDFEKLGVEGGAKDGGIVWIRGRVSSVRAKGNACFMVLRSGSFNTVQACHFKDKENPDESKKMIKYAGSLPLESIVDIMGIVVAADVKSCSVSNVEIQIKRIYAVRVSSSVVCATSFSSFRYPFARHSVFFSSPYIYLQC
jgi:lysyl-tRNA synthetase class II